MNTATYTVGAPFDFGQGVAKALVIPPGVARVEIRGTLTLPSSRPAGHLWPVIGVALGDKDKRRAKPATLTIGDGEQWRLEGPGIANEQKGGVRVSWGERGSLSVTWAEDAVTVDFNGKRLFAEPLRPGPWDTAKGGLIWLGVNAGGEYSPLAGGTLTVTAADFGPAGSGSGGGGGGVGGGSSDPFAEFEAAVAAAVAKLRQSLSR